jgi:hypothetical protein
LLRIPDEYKPFAALGIGSLILVGLVLFHGISLHRILLQFKRGEMRLRTGPPHRGRAAFLFGWAIFLMLLLHLLEIMTWAYLLVHLGLIVKAADAIYFCANAYTTLGYGVVDLGAHWRNISPVIAISGLFTFAWTTSVLVTIVHAYLQLVEQLEKERTEQLALRAAEREALLDVRTKEEQAESLKRSDTKKRVNGLSFFERRRVWREERQEEKQMRAAENSEIKSIRRQEVLEEKKLGDVTPPGNSEGDQ